MIESMKKVFLITETAKREGTLKDLRKAGILHVAETGTQSLRADELRQELDSVHKTLNEITDSYAATAKDKKAPVNQVSVSDGDFIFIHTGVLQMIDERTALRGECLKYSGLESDILPWGDFNPETVKYLKEKGISLTFCTLDRKELSKIPEDVDYIRLRDVSGNAAIAICSGCPTQNMRTFDVPCDSLSAVQSAIASKLMRIDELNRLIGECVKYSDSYAERIKKLEQDLRFEEVALGMGNDGSIAWVKGWLPEYKVEEFKKAASRHGWGYLIDDVGEDDNPPTEIRYAKGVGMIKPLFDLLGTVPGYREHDISLWFLVFFALFFGMIIGDAGYGLIFILIAAVLNIRQKKCTNLTALIYVVGGATVVWGALTGTWFGSEAILENSGLLQAFVIPQISNFPAVFGVSSVTAQNQVMKFCFMIGTIQLSLACVLSVYYKAPAKDLSLFADIGWMMIIIALYFLSLLLVIGAEVNTAAILVMVGIGFVMVFVFGCQKPGVSFLKGLAGGAGNLFTQFLNTISAFGNVMSYIRLFAVGLASVAISESFNGMASGMMHGAGIPAGVLILVIGHALNFVMGLLSVIVHGVRLNILEFSGQLGMEWSGYAYQPFCETAGKQDD